MKPPNRNNGFCMRKKTVPPPHIFAGRHLCIFALRPIALFSRWFALGVLPNRFAAVGVLLNAGLHINLREMPVAARIADSVFKRHGIGKRVRRRE